LPISYRRGPMPIDQSSMPHAEPLVKRMAAMQICIAPPLDNAKQQHLWQSDHPTPGGGQNLARLAGPDPPSKFCEIPKSPTLASSNDKKGRKRRSEALFDTSCLRGGWECALLG
jgi:hypothetical protein